MFSDSHCHMDGFESEQQLMEVLERAAVSNLDIILTMAMSLESSEEAIRLARTHRVVLAAVGIHPWNAVAPTDELCRRLEELATTEGVVALGEIGLDYARSPQTATEQRELLKYEMSLAREKGLPVNLHCREAHADMMGLLRGEAGSGLTGNIHGFSGDSDMLKDWLEIGFYIAIGRAVLRDMPGLEEAVTRIPSDRLLTETDATPRGQSAGPAEVVAVAEKVAALRGVTTEEIGRTATANLKRLLKL
ncbi:MAG: TatD family hydrolase [Dehalococcoidales bacterium]|nr:TatD family hydrolase [Dehalococcoidales bacterium]